MKVFYKPGANGGIETIQVLEKHEVEAAKLAAKQIPVVEKKEPVKPKEEPKPVEVVVPEVIVPAVKEEVVIPEPIVETVVEDKVEVVVEEPKAEEVVEDTTIKAKGNKGKK